MPSGTEYLTSNAHIAYPFRENATGLARTTTAVHGASATLPENFLVDSVIMVPPDVTLVYLSTIAAVAGTNYMFTFVDQDSNTILSDILDTATLDANDYYQTFTLDNAVGPVYGKFVILTSAFLSYLSGVTADSYQLRLAFEARAVNQRTPQIETFDLYTVLPDPPEPDTPGSISGEALIRGGYNVNVPAAESETDSDTTDIDMSATPGGGEGLYPCVGGGSSTFTRRFMHLVPDENGNIQLTPGEEDCYFIIPHPALESYEIQGNCVACCSCEDYQNTAKGLQNLLDRSKLILGVLNTARNTHYEVGVTRFNSLIAPRYIGVKLQVNGAGGAPYAVDPAIRSGSVNWGAITASIQNNGDPEVQPTSITITIASPVAAVLRQVLWEYDSTGGQFTGVAGSSTFSLAGLSPLARGKRLSFNISAYVAGTVIDPAWNVTVVFNYTESGTPASLTDSVTFT